MAISYGESWAEVCSRALEKMGAGGISNLTAGSREVNLCNRYLGTAISNVIGMHDWHALRTRLQLAPLSAAPVYGFDHAYPLPADFERMIEIDNGEAAYSVENGSILTAADDVYIPYIARPTNDPSRLPSTLKDLISCELASLLSEPMSASADRTRKILDDLARAKQAALSNDARLNPEIRGEADRGYAYYDELR